MERFTISLDDRLAKQFEVWRASRRYDNRSEAIRDLLRAELGKGRPANGRGAQCVACLSYVFNHHERDLAERLTGLQHEHHEMTMSTTHVHLDHEHCLETVLLRGPIDGVTAFADRLTAERGVHHGNINIIGVEMHEPHRKANVRARQAGKNVSASVHLHMKPAA